MRHPRGRDSYYFCLRTWSSIVYVLWRSMIPCHTKTMILKYDTTWHSFCLHSPSAQSYRRQKSTGCSYRPPHFFVHFRAYNIQLGWSSSQVWCTGSWRDTSRPWWPLLGSRARRAHHRDCLPSAPSCRSSFFFFFNREFCTRCFHFAPPSPSPPHSRSHLF